MTIGEKINTVNQEINETTPGSLERQTLQKLLEKLKELKEGGVVDVSCVVVAMNQQEASEFLEEKDEIFDFNQNGDITPNQTGRFQKLQEEFKQSISSDEQKRDWLAHYAAKREAWVPHIYPVERPKNTVVEIIERITINNHHYSQVKFWPDFIAARVQRPISGFFNSDDTVRKRAWRKLKGNFVVIIDGISVFHPRIRKALQNAPLERAAVVLLSPFAPVDDVINRLDALIEKEISLEMESTFDRFDEELDRACELGVNTERCVKRWLFANLTEITVSKPRAHPANTFGEDRSGIEQSVFNMSKRGEE